jgi:hypothetical protein
LYATRSRVRCQDAPVFPDDQRMKCRSQRRRGPEDRAGGRHDFVNELQGLNLLRVSATGTPVQLAFDISHIEDLLKALGY